MNESLRPARVATAEPTAPWGDSPEDLARREDDAMIFGRLAGLFATAP